MPSDYAVRRAAPDDARAIAEVRVDAWRATYRGMIPDAYLDTMSVDASAALWQRVLGAGPNSTSVFVAAADDAVVGFSCGNLLKEPKYDADAELSAIYLRTRAQRVGLGRRLLEAVVVAQRASGATGVLTWVIAANRGARRFYEALGASLVVEQPFEWDGMALVEAGYVWRDLEALILACRAAPPSLH